MTRPPIPYGYDVAAESKFGDSAFINSGLSEQGPPKEADWMDRHWYADPRKRLFESRLDPMEPCRACTGPLDCPRCWRIFVINAHNDSGEIPCPPWSED